MNIRACVRISQARHSFNGFGEFGSCRVKVRICGRTFGVLRKIYRHAYKEDSQTARPLAKPQGTQRFCLFRAAKSISHYNVSRAFHGSRTDPRIGSDRVGSGRVGSGSTQNITGSSRVRRFSKTSWVGSGRIRRCSTYRWVRWGHEVFQNLVGRVRSGQEVLKISLGRVGPGGFQVAQTGSHHPDPTREK